eukprot:CAMPEP_0114419246 /NCGR_PEP_ID=MMETSP0103-20121206/3925_1 /TAXON_ID=37642 ORGANISM="Paraphysomonas imperforata, Strain PA2" /NCGR_SAMPLE_ID=MMETSP0103 /ASSEMBLY_ACC=CAM_ASM_000201 /LENGTH=400 /DNA_ID=CAMNT_0001587653 /DNA_START=100 /DNA_END=1299 /DNA_ORIENTATION=-
MTEVEDNFEVSEFTFNFHKGFDLYVAVRCGKKAALDELESLQTDPISSGYLAMSLARSENSIIPKDIPRVKELCAHFLPLMFEMTINSDKETIEFLADVHYLIAFCQENGIVHYFVLFCFSVVSYAEVIFEFLTGYAVSKDPVKSVENYRESVALGHPGAAVNLSNCYDDGVGVAVNKAKVFELCSFAAGVGHPIGLNNLGCCYLFGKGCSINHVQKMRLWEKAAKMGYPMSQVNIGLTYFYGEGVRTDEATAVRYFQQGVKAGLCRAQLMLGYCYYRGSGINGDVSKAIEYCGLAAAQGNASAQYQLGCILYNRSFDQADREKAISTLQEAANSGSPDAQYFIGCCYCTGIQGKPKSIIEAVRFLRKAAIREHAESISRLNSLQEEYKEELWQNRKSFW